MEEPNRIIEVSDPLHIPAIVYSLEERSLHSDKPFYTLLEHKEEPCIIRGVGQALIGGFDSQKGYHVVNGIPEIKRQDGGNSWYHGPTTCLIKTTPFTKNLVEHKKNYHDWHDELADLYKSYSQNSVVRRLPHTADLYSKSDLITQVFGTSAYNNVLRACWYEDLSKMGGLLNLVRQDPQVENIIAFERCSGFAKQGFRKYISDLLSFKDTIGSENFISDSSLERSLALQHKPGALVGPCISGQYPLKVSEEELEIMRGRSRNV